MGLFSSIGNIVKSVTKPVKKVLKSPVGIAAILGLGLPAYARYGQGLPGTGVGSFLGKGSKMAKLGQYLYGSPTSGSVGTSLHGTGKGIIPATKGLLTKHPAITAGVGTALTAGVAAPELEEEINIDVDDPTAHKKYLTNRGMFEDEWAEWLVSKGDADTKEEALEIVRANPMFSGGGRVKAQGGLFAGQMPGRHPSMNPMNQMNQGLGAPNLGSRSMGMTPGMGAGQDPRMAQMMQGQGRGRPRTGAVPGESPDTELIQLIKMLTSLGIPMEQLRGRTKEELVEMLVSVKGKMGGEPDVKETAGVIEEEDIRETQEVAGGGRIGLRFGGPDWFTIRVDELVADGMSEEDAASQAYDEGPGGQETRAQGGLMRSRYALGHSVIPSKDGMQLDMRDSGGYQPHGKAEKHDDVRALLAQGEFVMTSDAVKGMGGGDREMGAKKMYNLMHNMEALA